MSTNFVDEARKQLSGQFEANKTQLQNNFNTDMYELDSQTGIMNKEYDGKIEGAKQTGENNKAAYNNSTINRGLARSSIATTGLTGINNTTAKNVNALEGQRQMQLDNIDKLKTMLRNNLTNSLSALQSAHDSNVNSLAMQLQDRYDEKQWRQQQAQLQQQQWQAEMDFKREQFNADNKYKYDVLAQKEKTSSSSSSEDKAAQMSQFISASLSQLRGAAKNGDIAGANIIIDNMIAGGASTEALKQANKLLEEAEDNSLSLKKETESKNKFSLKDLLNISLSGRK